MKKALVGTALALFAVAPAMAWADCDFHNKASMASSQPNDKAGAAQQQAANKASTPAVVKTSAKQVKQTRDKPASSPSKTDGSNVVAKNN